MKKRGNVNVVPVSSDVSVSSNVDVDRAIASASARGSLVALPKMPWESSHVMRMIFDSDTTPWLQPVKVPRLMPAGSMPLVRSAESKLLEQRVKIREACHKAANQMPTGRTSAVLKWAEIILLSPTSFTTGRQLMSVKDDREIDERSLQVVADTLRSKATSTVNLRAASMALYCRWFAKASPDESPFPILEETIYEYMCDLRGRACSASRASTFLGTLNFAATVFGLQGASQAAESQRNKGASIDMFLQKRPLRQAPALHPVMIVILEIAAFCEIDPYLRALAGACLCCLYGRLRVSDLGRLVHASVLGSYVEGSLQRVKTQRTKEKQCTFLPVIFPSCGLSGAAWFEAFTMSREDLDLPLIPPLSRDRPSEACIFMPSRQSLGYEILNKIEADEITDGLKLLLGKILPVDQVRDLSSHSLKTTLLTYMGVYGVDYTVIELLGYHLTSHKSTINYQRDALAYPIRLLMKALNGVASGEFQPFAPRDEVFPETARRVSIQAQLHEQTGLDITSVAARFMECSDRSLYNHQVSSKMRKYWNLLCTMPNDFEQTASPSLATGTDPLEQRMTEVVDSDDEASDSDDSGASSVESGFALVARGGGDRSIRNVSIYANETVFYRHRRTRMLHMGHIHDEVKTACGRVVSEQFLPFTGDAERSWPHCRICFGTFNA